MYNLYDEKYQFFFNFIGEATNKCYRHINK